MWKYIFSNDTPLFPDWNHWVYSAATASVYLAFNGRLCCRQRWKVSEPRGERDKQEANRCNQMNNVCPSLPSQYLVLQNRKGVVDNELKKCMGKPPSAFPAPLHADPHRTMVCIALPYTHREQHEPLCFQNHVEQASSYFCFERTRYWYNYVNRADKKLWGDTCFKINQVSYAYHSFQSWQVTPPARIMEYIYNSIA